MRVSLSVASTLDMTTTIRNRVKELRDDRGWTQLQLAEAVGVSRQSINSIERDRYVPSLELALHFARVFNCPVDRIFTLEAKK
jgi:putative transcriptional regulator